MKFGRVYTLLAEGRDTSFAKGTQHVINFPLTCRFKVNNAALPFAGESVFQIFNLAPEVRRDLQKDYFQKDVQKIMTFSAGYASDLPIPTIFQGTITTAFSYRQGPDWITEITGRDGCFAQQNAQINLSFPSPYILKDILARVVETMKPYGVTQGAIGDFSSQNSRGTTFCGNTWDLLINTILPLDAQISISKGKIYILNQNEIIKLEGTIDKIDADSGLLESPRHQDNMLMCKMIFEPRMEMFQEIEVSSIEPGNSGKWKIQRVDHLGTISGAVGETLNTNVTLFRTGEEFAVAA